MLYTNAKRNGKECSSHREDTMQKPRGKKNLNSFEEQNIIHHVWVVYFEGHQERQDVILEKKARLDNVITREEVLSKC